VNVSHLAAKPHVTSGIGGFIDITSRARQITFIGFFTAGGLKVTLKNGKVCIEQEGQSRKFVPIVEQITFSGRRARQRGQRVTYLTERCVLSLEADGLTVTEIAPGIDLERDILGQTAIPLRVSSNLQIMDQRLFTPEPMGLVLQRH
jgi:acyl CoA:acetate/3-ketoacid CoA transferase